MNIDKKKLYDYHGKLLSLSEIEADLTTVEKNILKPGSRYFDVYNLMKRGEVGLDYGCGFGQFTKKISEISEQVIGIDYSENEIEVANLFYKDSKNLEFQNVGIDTFPDNNFDFVISNQVAEHVHNVGNYFAQINRVLKSNGRLIVSIPNISTPRYFLMPLSKKYHGFLKKRSLDILENYHKPSIHINSWDAYHFVTLLASCGFSLQTTVESEGIALPPQLSKFKIPTYIPTKKLFKGWSYTLIFSFVKSKHIDIGHTD